MVIDIVMMMISKRFVEFGSDKTITNFCVGVMRSIEGLLNLPCNNQRK